MAAATAFSILGLWIPGRAGDTLFAVAALSLPALMLLFGEPRRGHPRWLIVAALVSCGLLVGGFLSLVALTGGDPTGRWLLGLPLSLAIPVYGMALGPLLVLGVLYAIDFERFQPRPEDLERIRSLADDGT